MSIVTESLVGQAVSVKFKRSFLGSDIKFCPLFAATLTGMAGRFAFFREIDGSEIIISISTIADIRPLSTNASRDYSGALNGYSLVVSPSGI